MTAEHPLTADQSGLYRPPASVACLRKRADASGAAWLEVDLAFVRDKSELLRTIARAGGFSETFGANWDALADSLQDLSWRPAPGYVIHLQGGKGAAQSLGPDWSTFIEILGGTAAFWRLRGKPFIVLVDDGDHLPVLI